MNWGGKQSASDRQAQGYQTGYSMYQSGVDPVSVFGRDQTNLNTGAYAGWEAAGQKYQQEQAMMGMFAEMMHSMSQPQQQQSGPSYEQQMADQQAEYERQLAEQRRMQGISDRDSLYGDYLTAASSSTDYINSQIAKEQSNAALLGIDYAIDDVKKGERISNYFASVWGEGEQSRLEQLMGEWGNPSGFEDWTVRRGDASAHLKPGGDENLVGQSTGRRPVLSLTDDDESEFLGV